MINSILQSNKITSFIVLVFISWTIQFISNEFIITDEVWYSTYGEQLTIEQIDGLLEWNMEYWWFSYLFAPVVLSLKILMITLALIIGGVLFDVSLSFKKTFGIVILTEFIFIIPSLFQMIWFISVEELISLNDMTSFTPWTLYYYLSQEELMSWTTYLLNLINVFEVIFILLLTYLIKRYLLDSEKTEVKAYKIVLYGYGSGLLTWAVFITFLSIQYS
ncbi:hypothetical protein [Flammeovirga aprica]|uniref:Yip1 domain-containing protein n=1 Tax=Flammeovirga aprica JL-4 TaxID=694437 RepID=A0A7X9XD24_9BACT|nr:hypothetical protein [Flammeovirga aprica]NME72417.1 hypothetical protein [Flammeovirga aprica JL-4]